MTQQEIHDLIMSEPEKTEPVEPHWLVTFGHYAFTSQKETRAEAITEATERARKIGIKALKESNSCHVPPKPGGEFQWGDATI